MARTMAFLLSLNMRKKQDIIWEQSTLITKQIQAIKMEFPKPELHFILFLQ